MAVLVLAYTLVDLVWVQRLTGFVFNDAWEHTAALKALLEAPFAPANPHVATGEPSPRFMPLFVGAALVGKALGLGPIALLKGLTLFNLALILVGVFLFFRAYFRDPWAPVVGLAVVLGAWGTGFVWSNATALRALPVVAGYPSGFVFGLTLIVWWLALATLKQVRTGRVLAGALTAAGLLWLALTVHVLTGAFTVGGLVLLIVFADAATWRNRVALLLAIPVGALLVELWPYFSTLNIFLDRLPALSGGQGGQAAPAAGPRVGLSRAEALLSWHPFYQPRDVLSGLGAALLGIPLAVYLAWRRAHPFIVLGLAGLLAVYLGHLFLKIPMGHRALLFAVFFAHLAITAFILDWMHASAGPGLGARLAERPWATAVVGVVGLAVLANVLIALRDIRSLDPGPADPATLAERADWPQVYGELTASLGGDAVVFGRLKDTWPLPTFAGKTVGLAHANPLIRDYRERARDVRRFYTDRAGDEERLAILARWNATHVLARPPGKEREPVTALLEGHGVLAGAAGPLVLYRLSPAPVRPSH